MSHDIKNTVVFITGAASGIGEWVIRYMLDEGAKHITFTDIDQTKGTSFEKELISKYGANKAKFIKCDSTEDDELMNAFKWVIDAFGYIDVVINNAGIMNDTLKLYKKAINLNVTAVVTGTLKAVEVMRKDEGGKGGTVINISSVAGITQESIMPIYYASKSAVLQFSNCMGHADNYNRTGVRVIAMCFGATTTPLLYNIKPFDPKIEEDVMSDVVKKYPTQSVEAAAKGLVEAYKKGESGSTWLVQADKTRDITSVVRQAYGLLEDIVFNE